MLRRTFLKGLFATIPLAVTIAIVTWIYSFFDNFFGAPLRELLGPYYYSGMGLAAAVIFIFCLGLFLDVWVFEKIYTLIDKLLNRIPLVKTLYRSVRDFMSFFQGEGGQVKGRVVMVHLVPGVEQIGIVTRENFDDFAKGEMGGDKVAVFIPLSYQIGGHTVIVPKDKVRPLPLNAEQALRFIVTGGMVTTGDKR